MILTAPDRAKIMASIGSPEKALRIAMTSLGMKYQLHRKELPGTPNIVMKKWKLAVFVKRYEGEMTYLDLIHYKDLEKMGWTVVMIWEQSIEASPMEAAQVVLKVRNHIYEASVAKRTPRVPRVLLAG